MIVCLMIDAKSLSISPSCFADGVTVVDDLPRRCSLCSHARVLAEAL
jgi:hypothetical protein